jgi:hypothetical protein
VDKGPFRKERRAKIIDDASIWSDKGLIEEGRRKDNNEVRLGSSIEECWKEFNWIHWRNKEINKDSIRRKQFKCIDDEAF